MPTVPHVFEMSRRISVYEEARKPDILEVYKKHLAEILFRKISNKVCDQRDWVIKTHDIVEKDPQNHQTVFTVRVCCYVRGIEQTQMGELCIYEHPSIPASDDKIFLADGKRFYLYGYDHFDRIWERVA